MEHWSVGPYQLRPYQIRTIERLRESISRLRKEKKPAHVVLQSVCGSGKSVMACKIAELTAAKGGRFLFIVNGRSLISQMSEKFAECGIRHGVLMAGSENSIDHEWAVHHKASIQDIPIVVASRDTYGSRVFNKECIKALKIDVCAIDELQLGVSGTTYKRLVNDNLDKVVIGLTATPSRAGGLGFGPPYQEIITGGTHEELLREGFIVEPVCYGPRTVDMKGVKISRSTGEYVVSQAEERWNKEELIGDLIRDWRKYGEDRPTIVYASSVEHSKHIAANFCGHGVSAIHLDAESPLNERRKVFRDLASGGVKVLTNFGIARVGVDIPEVGCGVLACSMASINPYLQSTGRLIRGCKSVYWRNGGPKDNCIAEGSLVLTRRGLVAIEKVSNSDRLWDGSSWVSHGGVVFKGEQDVIKYCGVTATPDHLVWTRQGWRSLESCRKLRIQLCQTGMEGSEIRVGRNYIGDVESETLWPCYEKGTEKERVLLSEMRGLWLGGMDSLRQSKTRPHQGLSPMQSAEAISDMAVGEGCRREAKMHEQQKHFLERLRWQRDSFQFPDSDRSLFMDQGQSWDLQGFGTGSRRQQRALRSRESKVVNAATEQVAHQTGDEYGENPQIQDGLSRYQVCGCDSFRVFLNWNDCRADSCAMGEAVIQTKRRVWDILNAGPLHRFTVSGVLVHNCVLIDHGGNIKKHGWPTEDRFWTLDPEKDAEEFNKEKKEEEGKKEIPVLHCVKCGAEWQATDGNLCPRCGYKKQSLGSAPSFDGQELGRIKKSAAKTVPRDDQKVWGQCLGIAANRGFSYRQAIRMFEKKARKRFSLSSVSPVAESSQNHVAVSKLWPGFVRGGKEGKES